MRIVRKRVQIVSGDAPATFQSVTAVLVVISLDLHKQYKQTILDHLLIYSLYENINQMNNYTDRGKWIGDKSVVSR